MEIALTVELPLPINFDERYDHERVKISMLLRSVHLYLCY